MALDLIYSTTSDFLHLPGIHFIPDHQTDTCLLVVHGMSGNILENYWGDVLGRTLSAAGIGCIYSHNRGYGMISDPAYADPKTLLPTTRSLRAGAVYERFADCVLDIAAWLDAAHALGYSRIFLFGHSLGGPKVLKFLFDHPTTIDGLILASPADMPGLARKYQSDFSELLAEAEDNLAAGRPQKLLSRQIYDWYQLSSQTFIDLFTENGPADVFPILRHPPQIPHLAKISCPLLVFYGQHDDSYVLDSPAADLERIKSYATSAPSVTAALISDAGHSYQGHEQSLSSTVLDWINRHAIT